MKISDLTLDELKELVKGLVDDRLRELLGDPDLGMELGEAVRARLRHRWPRTSGSPEKK